MDSVALGRTGVPVSRLVIGTMNFGFQLDEGAAQGILSAAAEEGITAIDTADMYPTGGPWTLYGTTESIIGRWLAGSASRRDEVFLATKFYYPSGPQEWDRGGSRKNVIRACDESLRRLGTDRIDLYQMHAWDDDCRIEETLSALDTLRRDGKILYAGACNFQAWQVALALGASAAHDWVRFDVVEPRYNLLYRNFERDLFPLCEREGIAVIPYNPLAGGLLTGKHAITDGAAGTRFALPTAAVEYRERYWHQDQFDAVSAIVGIAGEAGITPHEMALRWLLNQPQVTAPIIGATRPEHVHAASNAVSKGPLPDDLARTLSELTHRYRVSELAD